MSTKKVFCKRCGELNRFDQDDATCICDECRADERFFNSPGVNQSYTYAPNPQLQARVRESREGSGCMEHMPGGGLNLDHAGVEALDYRKLIDEFRQGGFPNTEGDGTDEEQE